MRVILDTSVVVGSVPKAADLEAAISCITLAELHFGVLTAKEPSVRAERLRRLGIVERALDALPVDEAVAREYGRIAAAVKAGGRQPRARFADLMIAATAAAHSAQVWTRNASDFVHVEHLVTVVDVS